MSAPIALPSGSWQLDARSTTVTASVKKMGMFTIPATLGVVSGTIEIDDNHQVTRVEVVTDATSYASKNAKRNEHVVGADFLDAENHPTITFSAASLTATPDGYQAVGSVTVKGKPSPIEVSISDIEVGESNGSFTASATVDRMSVGVDKMPTLIVGRELQIAVSAKATKVET